MGRKINTFSKAIKHLKSSKYDMLEAAPTNNTMGFMSKDVHGFDTELQPDTRTYASPDFTQDDSPDDTSGLFEADGTPKTALPGGDTSYILGPMSAMWYAWANYTQIGYIREADRRMVNLGRITGQLGSWDQETGFTSYGQLTLEQAQWFYNVKKYNNADNDTPNYRAFYPGPPSNTPDEDGRYLCVITGEPKQTGGSGPVDGPKPPTPDGHNPGDHPYPKDKDKDKDKDDEDKDERAELLKRAAELDRSNQKTVDILNATTGTEVAAAAAIPVGIATWKLVSLVLAAGAMSNEELRNALSNWNGITRSGDIDTDWPDSGLSDEEWEAQAQRGRERDAEAARQANERTEAAQDELTAAQESGNQDRIDRAEEEVKNAERNQERVRSNNTRNRQARTRARRERYGKGQGGIQGGASAQGSMGGGYDTGAQYGSLSQSYKPQGKVLSESRKSHILKNLKNPVVIPEEQKKFKVKPKIRGLKTVVSKPVETPKEYKKVGGRNLWGKAEYDYNTRQSQERKNETLELLGASDHHWEYMTETSKKKNAEEMAKFYGDHPDLYTYTFGGKKQKVLRKEQLKGDYLVFLIDENGVKTNMLQSKLNEKLVEEEDKKFLEEYNKLNPKPKRNDRISYEKDPLFKKVANRLKKEINYPDKPAKMGYPDTPPPEMVNDRHPDFGKRPGTSMFNRLDPQTAKAMPKQDDPIIDKKVEAAKKKPK